MPRRPQIIIDKADEYGASYAYYHECIQKINDYGCLHWRGRWQPWVYVWDQTKTRRRRCRTTPAKLAFYVEYGIYQPRINCIRLCSTEDCIAPAHHTNASVRLEYRNWAPEELVNGRTTFLNGENVLIRNPHYPNIWERHRMEQTGSIVEPAPALPPDQANIIAASILEQREATQTIKRQQAIAEILRNPELRALADPEFIQSAQSARVGLSVQPERSISLDIETQFRRTRALQQQAREEEVHNAKRPIDPRTFEQEAMPPGFDVVATYELDGADEAWIVRFTIEACAAPAPLRLCPSAAGETYIPLAPPGTILFGTILPNVFGSDLIVWTEESKEIAGVTKLDRYKWIIEEAYEQAEAALAVFGTIIIPSEV